MMAIYGGLNELGQSLAAHLRSFGGSLVATHYGQPLENPVQTTESVRLTMLWVTPQPTHRNDAPFRNPAGMVQPAPLTLSVYLMVSTYGGDVDPASAYQLLGRVLRIFHEAPVLALPIDGVGSGELTMALVPTAADLMEKVFSPLQLKHRPFAIYEAAPVQLRSDATPSPGAPPVKPGGIGLTLTPRPPPAIVRVTPERQVPGGALRVDVSLGGAALGALTIDGVTVPALPIAGTDAVRVVIPASVAGSVATLALRTSPAPGSWSDAYGFGILPADAASVDAPHLGSSTIGAPLTLFGRGLGGASAALLWPDEGTPGDGDVRELALAAVAPTQVTLGGATIAAALGAAPGRRSLVGLPVRVVLRLAGGTFTPYIVLRFVP